MADNFGDRIKTYERIETGRKFIPLLPVYARIDGKNFSKLTKGLQRPFDHRFSRLMIDTASFLVKETNAIISYVQSDEINLLWYSDNVDKQIFFDGKIFKMTSVLASMTTAFFNKNLKEYIPEKEDRCPIFDCRVFQLPTLMEAANTLLWREHDATKNAISMGARSMFSHNDLYGKTGNEMQEMMWQKYKMNFNNYPDFFKRGTFISKKQVEKFLTEEEMNKIPEGHRPSNPVIRHEIVELEMPKFSTVTNRIGVIFNNEQPIVEKQIDE